LTGLSPVVDNTVVVKTTVAKTTPSGPAGSPRRPARRSADSVPTRVLVLGMAHEDGTVLAAELFPVAEACGQSGEQVRSCLRRVVAEGLFVRAGGSGSTARYQATAAGMAALGATMERTLLAYSQDAAGRGWDRQWRLVAFALPESRRRDRQLFRDRLRALGGAAIQGGLYVSPHPWHKEVADQAEALGIESSVAMATTDDLDVGGERDPRQLARRLWPLDELAEGYEAFVQRYRDLPSVLAAMRRRRDKLADASFLPGALSMAVGFQACFEGDPLLPPELLPRPWPGRTARDLLVTCRRLALSIRRSAGRPALFRLFDDAIEQMPLTTGPGGP
jgi:phenylacetic acid degradation operon negative regulatory protein